MSTGKHRLPKSLRHPVGSQPPSVYWRRRAFAIASVLVVVALLSVSVSMLVQRPFSTVNSADDESVAQEVSVAEKRQRPSTASTVNKPRTGNTPGEGGTSSTTAEPTGDETVQEPVSDPDDSQDSRSEEPSPQQVGSWSPYPWGSNGLECPHPATSAGATASYSGPPVVVLGDSLVRNSRSAVDAALAAYGIRPVFVCWGGKTLTWGAEQITTMRSLNLVPDCLVINLGTNDLKGTTANNLTDAVSLINVQQRLVGLLSDVRDIPHVFVIDIAANLGPAPATMFEIDQAPVSWRNAVAQTGVGEVLAWSARVKANPSLIGADGIHDSDSGVTQRASLIAESVARYCM